MRIAVILSNFLIDLLSRIYVRSKDNGLIWAQVDCCKEFRHYFVHNQPNSVCVCDNSRRISIQWNDCSFCLVFCAIVVICPQAYQFNVHKLTLFFIISKYSWVSHLMLTLLRRLCCLIFVSRMTFIQSISDKYRQTYRWYKSSTVLEHCKRIYRQFPFQKW